MICATEGGIITGVCSAVLGYVNTSQEADIRTFGAWWGHTPFCMTVKILVIKK